MFSGAALPVERPADWRRNSSHHPASSSLTSPAASRNSSFASTASAQTEPGLTTDHSRQSSVVSTAASSTASGGDAPHKSGFRSLFSRTEKKPKEKKDVEKIVLTSKHAAAVKTRMMLDPRFKDKKPVKTAGIVQSIHTGHMTAAQQEMRHPHSGPPALHGTSEMPSLTRIVSGDECDDEDEFDKMERTRAEWEAAKGSAMPHIHEHERERERDSDSSLTTSAEQSADEGTRTPPSRECALSPTVEKSLSAGEIRRPLIVTRNSCGGRFHRDQSGHWKR